MLIDDDYFRSPRELGPGEFVTGACGRYQAPGCRQTRSGAFNDPTARRRPR